MAKRYDWVKGKKTNYENTLSSIVRSVVKPSLKNNSKAESEILLNWSAILGDKFSQKIDFKKIKPVERKKSIYNLYISIRKRDSLEISHSKDLIIEKFNTYFGYAVIKDIIISNDKKPSPKSKTTLLSSVSKSNDSEINSKDYGLKDEGLVEIFRNIERNIGEKND